jgi:hypothetical protein
MRRLGLLAIVVGVVVAASLAVSPLRVAAKGGDYHCNNQTLTAMTISGNLVVPSGAFCDLVGSTVTGNATVEPTGAATLQSNAGLLLDSASSIGGDVQVQKNGQFAEYNGSSVGGDVQCNQCGVADAQDSSIGGSLHDNGISQGAFILNDSIGGDLQIDHGVTVSGGPFDIQTNTIGGNLMFNHNTGTSTITNNHISKTLACDGNQPPPTGGGNTAAQKKGQCASL